MDENVEVAAMSRGKWFLGKTTEEQLVDKTWREKVRVRKGYRLSVMLPRYGVLADKEEVDAHIERLTARIDKMAHERSALIDLTSEWK